MVGAKGLGLHATQKSIITFARHVEARWGTEIAKALASTTNITITATFVAAAATATSAPPTLN